MKYQITQKFMAVGGDYSVKDDTGREVYYFDGKVFSFGGKKVEVLDSNRNQVAIIKKKLFTFMPAYRVTRSGIESAVIRKRAFTFRDQFIIDIPGLNDYQVVGDYIGREYTIKRGPNDAARISKRFFGGTDSYGVEVHSGDPFLMLCAVVVIDMVLYKRTKTN